MGIENETSIKKHESTTASSFKNSEKIESTDLELMNGVWFSQRENKWDVRSKFELLSRKPKFFWTGEVEIWDWDSCNISLARTLDKKLKVVIRSKTNKNSMFMGNKPVKVRYMLGFDLEKVSEPKVEEYTARESLGDPEKIEGPKKRWVFQLNDDYWIWEWAVDGEDITSSKIYRLYTLICKERSDPSINGDNIFDVETKGQDEDIIPVVYQPAVDSLKNFVREVHCASCKEDDGCDAIDVSIIFNNEQLRKHAYINTFYETFRYFWYGRTLDVETFRIKLNKDVADNKFIFENIYSDHNPLEEDSIHGDPPKAPERGIKYYFTSHNHPVIFINTSNHAMAEHDTNHRIWKWEYIPWTEDAPIKFGKKTREEIEEDVEKDINIEIENKPRHMKTIFKFLQKHRRNKG